MHTWSSFIRRCLLLVSVILQTSDLEAILLSGPCIPFIHPVYVNFPGYEIYFKTSLLYAQKVLPHNIIPIHRILICKVFDV